jgi:GNAT superfamily N-acetyltransferase
MLSEFNCLNKIQKKEVTDLYLLSFPLNERRDFDFLLEGLRLGNYQMLVYLKEKSVYGLSFVYFPEHEPFALLDYFAIIPEKQGIGIGSQCFLELVHRMRCEGRSLLMEVEDPTVGTNKDEKEKRIRFYERNGARMLEKYDYYLPDLSGHGEPTPMKLMIAPSEPQISRKKLIQFIKLIFKELYLRGDKDAILMGNLQRMPRKLIY